MFPNRMKAFKESHSEVFDLNDRIKNVENVKAYLESTRRTKFTNNGLFRHYEELD